ncbi:MAG TPA: SpoIIE family protein phosphatase [Pyrinomonadaceae bacterium]|nr:SpoIIE family protein phosphatase [Pyrinomonadaceae bacterium]
MTGGLVEIPGTNSMAAPVPLTLIADDQPDVLMALRLLLRGAGYQTEAVSSPAAVLEAIRHRDFDLVLMDLNYARDTTSGQEGLDLITNIRTLDSNLPVVVLTAWGSVELAVEAMHRGVRDFVQKPWDNSQLLRSLRMQIEAGRKRRLEKRLEAENRSATEHLHQELSESQEIQEALLPKELPAIEGIEVAVTWKPAHAVSGDYFDVIKFSDRHTALCVADVAGKGMPAALMMSNMQAVLKSIASDVTAPADLCARVNSVMCHNIVSHRFISCFYALLDTKTRKLAFSNAGHCPPMLIRDGKCTRLKDGGPVLGIFPDRLYAQDEIGLQSGDCVVLYTDGITEASDAEGQEFGEERLMELLMVGHKLHATELRDRVMSAVNEFSAGHADDDATLMVLTVE